MIEFVVEIAVRLHLAPKHVYPALRLPSARFYQLSACRFRLADVQAFAAEARHAAGFVEPFCVLGSSSLHLKTCSKIQNGHQYAVTYVKFHTSARWICPTEDHCRLCEQLSYFEIAADRSDRIHACLPSFGRFCDSCWSHSLCDDVPVSLEKRSSLRYNDILSYYCVN